MKNNSLTHAVESREVEQRKEKGSILLFAVTVLLFFSGLAVFLKTVLDPQAILDAREAQQAIAIDMTADSGFEAYAATLAAALSSSSDLVDPEGKAGQKLVDALNDVAEVTILDKDGAEIAVFHTNHTFRQDELRVLEKTGGWLVKSDDAVTWQLRFADGGTLTRRAALNLWLKSM